MRKSTMQRIDYEDFKKIDLRIGTIIEVEGFSNAKNPPYKI
jgi:tRNA-binding protein